MPPREPAQRKHQSGRCETIAPAAPPQRRGSLPTCAPGPGGEVFVLWLHGLGNSLRLNKF